MTVLSCVLCRKCQLTCRFFRFVVNIEEMRYSLPGHHCRSSQTLPCTTDPKCPAPSRHRIRAWLLSHLDLRRISAACCGYLRCPYRSDNHIPHNLPSLPAWPASLRRKCRVWQALPSPADLLVHSKAGISVLVIPSAHGQSRYVAGIVIQHLVHCLLVAPHRAAAVFPIPYAAFQYRKDGCPVIVVF